MGGPLLDRPKACQARGSDRDGKLTSFSVEPLGSVEHSVAFAKTIWNDRSFLLFTTLRLGHMGRYPKIWGKIFVRSNKSPGGRGVKREVGEGVFRLPPTGTRGSLGGRQGNHWGPADPAAHRLPTSRWGVEGLSGGLAHRRSEPSSPIPSLSHKPITRRSPFRTFHAGTPPTSVCSGTLLVLPPRSAHSAGRTSDGQDHSKRQRQRARRKLHAVLL